MTARRYLVPEVVQTSALDCGPAVVQSLLAGHGLQVRYERLREACQTDVDGTAISTLERLLPELGLAVEQVLIPLDHVLQVEAGALPAIVVLGRPGGFAHFAVAWRRHGSRVQVMDPASGRVFPSRASFESQLYVHTERVPASAWLAWAQEREFTAPLRARLRAAGLNPQAADALLDRACGQPGWRALAALDATARLIALTQHGRHRLNSREAAAVARSLWERAAQAQESVLPPACWCVQPDAPVDAEHTPQAADDEVLLAFRGAVLLRVTGRTRSSGAVATHTPPEHGTQGLSATLRARLQEPEPALWRRLSDLLGHETRRLVLAALLCALAGGLAAGLEALLWNAIIEHGDWPLPRFDRVSVWVAALGLVALLATLEATGQRAACAAGRRFEARLRSAFLHAAPRLGERLLRGRLRSDLAERSHAAFALRELPAHLAGLLRPAGELAVTLAALGWLYPSSLGAAMLTTLLAIAAPLLTQSWLAERDLRVRTHAGALARFHLDALLGLLPLRAHGGGRALMHEHDQRLATWLDAGVALQRATVWGDLVRGLLAYGLVVWIVWAEAGRPGGGALLLVYWALHLPELGAALALALAQWPRQRSLLRRLLEPLDDVAPLDRADEVTSHAAASPRPRQAAARPGVTLDWAAVDVQVAGRPVLNALTLHVAAGEHVAILGASGAGKSTLVALLLGLHAPSAGSLCVDDRPLTEDDWSALRAETAWVDPTVHLWRASLYSNLRFGAADSATNALHLPDVLRLAQLDELVAGLPRGLDTALGEGGALVSGGEGQRVRFGRALLRAPPRLVLLDEAFRGLPRAQRRTALEHARAAWPQATCLIVTHDVAVAQSCDRVVILDQGCIVENGRPAELVRAPSRFAALLEAEDALQRLHWADQSWRRWQVAETRVHEHSLAPHVQT